MENQSEQNKKIISNPIGENFDQYIPTFMKYGQTYMRTRTLNIIYGGLIAISIVILPNLLQLTTFDVSTFISILALAVGIPILGYTILGSSLTVPNKEEFDKIWKRVHDGEIADWKLAIKALQAEEFIKSQNIFGTIGIIGSTAIVIGIAGVLWHASWVVGIVFLATVLAIALFHLFFNWLF